MALGKLHRIVAATCQTARSLTPVRHTISNPHSSQPDPHMASGHILIVSLSTMQKDWLQQFAPMFGVMCKDVYLGFSMSWTSSVYFGRVQKKRFSRHEVLPSSRHRSRTMLSKAKHLTPTPSTAARRCAQRDPQFIWQRRSHSQADDPPGADFFAPFLTFWCHIKN